MKKKILIISSILTILIISLVVYMICKPKYTIMVSMVDDRSPDRILTVYKNDTEKIEVNRIEYLDGTLLCNGYNLTVHFGDIEKEEKLKIIFKDKSSAEAKIVKEEVKK